MNILEEVLENSEANKKEKCRTCQHRERWQFNTVFIQYCGVNRTNKTKNGLMKIKASNPACEKYQAETK